MSNERVPRRRFLHGAILAGGALAGASAGALQAKEQFGKSPGEDTLLQPATEISVMETGQTP
ncbi:MAG: hypothetical protein ACOC8H_00505 [bacterium]